MKTRETKPETEQFKITDKEDFYQSADNFEVDRIQTVACSLTKKEALSGQNNRI